MNQEVNKFTVSSYVYENNKDRIASYISFMAKIAIFLTLALIFIGILIMKIPITPQYLIAVFFIFANMIPMFLIRVGRVRLAGVLFTIILWIVINYSTIATGGVRAVGFGANMIVLVAAAILINMYAVFSFSIVTSLFGLLLAILQTRGFLPPVDINVSAYTSWLTQTGFFVFISGLLYIALDSIQRGINNTLRAEKEVRQLNLELSLAYDTTLDGWARALELKDKETEGHSRRVSGLTQRLAIACGVSKNKLKQIHYGALLHDIGKMAIPDEILNKPGKLTTSEQSVIEQHPITAYELLKAIKYLQKAIEIPYCHHEKWDGSGYPRGLKGKQIPLSARMFAVVDVWDALNSNRPYRKAWPRQKVINYMKEQSGLHFDPNVLEVFLEKVI